MSKSKKQPRTLHTHVGAVETWINDQEEAGQLMVAMGILPRDVYESGEARLEDFRVLIHATPELADRAADEDGDSINALFKDVEGGELGGPADDPAQRQEDEEALI